MPKIITKSILLTLAALCGCHSAVRIGGRYPQTAPLVCVVIAQDPRALVDGTKACKDLMDEQAKVATSQ